MCIRDSSTVGVLSWLDNPNVLETAIPIQLSISLERLQSIEFVKKACLVNRIINSFGNVEGEWDFGESVNFLGLVIAIHVVKQSLLISEEVVTLKMVVQFDC